MMDGLEGTSTVIARGSERGRSVSERWLRRANTVDGVISGEVLREIEFEGSPSIPAVKDAARTARRFGTRQRLRLELPEAVQTKLSSTATILTTPSLEGWSFVS